MIGVASESDWVYAKSLTTEDTEACEHVNSWVGNGLLRSGRNFRTSVIFRSNPIGR